MDNLNKKKKIKGKYNSTSYFYDERYKEIQFEKYQRIIKRKDLKNRTILDAGCGTGLISEFFQEEYDVIDQSNFKYVGVDLSIEMINIFKKKLGKVYRKALGFFNLILADLENLPFRVDSFNLLISITSYQNLPDVKRGVKESLRTLREKSFIIISILKKKLDKETLISLLEDEIEIIKFINDNKLEDFLISGRKIN
ncbi:MAG: class I SAM-dependent methyltransferase [Promethearchaeati archaeon]